MKSFSKLIFAIFILIGLIFACALYLNSVAIHKQSPPVTNEYFSSRSILDSVSTNANMTTTPLIVNTNARSDAFIIITDPQSGKHAIVKSNIVTLLNKSGDIIWSTNIAYLMETAMVYSLRTNKDYIVVVLTKNRPGPLQAVFVNKETGDASLVIY